MGSSSEIFKPLKLWQKKVNWSEPLPMELASSDLDA